MAQPWKIIESIATEDGTLELRQRGERDFIITIGPQILMNSLTNRSELALGQLGCSSLKGIESPKVLVAGLGMGFTLKAVLEELSPEAKVVVAELNPIVLQWCRGPLAGLTENSVSDPRVTVEINDVSQLIRQSANPIGPVWRGGPTSGLIHAGETRHAVRAMQSESGTRSTGS